MPKRRDDVVNDERVGIRISTGLRERAKNIRLMGAFRGAAESTFLAYLIEIGLAKYENVILPQEQEKPISVTSKEQEERVETKTKKDAKRSVA